VAWFPQPFATFAPAGDPIGENYTNPIGEIMAKAQKEAVALNEGDAVAEISAILEALPDNKSVLRVMRSVAALFDTFYIEESA
jgi:urease gamma subunit